jgi:hypothetical protein
VRYIHIKRAKHTRIHKRTTNLVRVDVTQGLRPQGYRKNDSDCDPQGTWTQDKVALNKELRTTVLLGPHRQDKNFQTGSNIWSQVSEWDRYQDILTDRQ